MDTVNLKKEDIRKKLIRARLRLLPEEVDSASLMIMSRVFMLEEFRKANIVMFYIDAKNEVKTRQAVKKALEMGKRVVVPKVKESQAMDAIEIEDLDELLPGTFGILEPIKDNGMSPEKIDMVIVPGVGFDRKGYRLGFGGGYYDNFLPKLRAGVKKVAVAFEIQVLDELPAEPHDARMDMIITQKTIYRF